MNKDYAKTMQCFINAIESLDIALYNIDNQQIIYELENEKKNIINIMNDYLQTIKELYE